jgi:peptide-methionine (S)-S-oxide reductase
MSKPRTFLRHSVLPVAAAAIVSATALLPGVGAHATDPERQLPAPLMDEAPEGSGPETLILAGGCSWGVQGVFQHVRGVTSAVSGYDGGSAGTAQYETVSTGTTGHAESVRITYDPHVVAQRS